MVAAPKRTAREKAEATATENPFLRAVGTVAGTIPPHAVEPKDEMAEPQRQYYKDRFTELFDNPPTFLGMINWDAQFKEIDRLKEIAPAAWRAWRLERLEQRKQASLPKPPKSDKFVEMMQRWNKETR